MQQPPISESISFATGVPLGHVMSYRNGHEGGIDAQWTDDYFA
jgi:hypothetical protein